MDGYSPHFGDADRLPTGNILGCYWPEATTAATPYDELVVEVVRDTKESAFELEVRARARFMRGRRRRAPAAPEASEDGATSPRERRRRSNKPRLCVRVFARRWRALDLGSSRSI